MERPSSTAKPRARRRWPLWLAGALAFYTVLGFFVAPPVVRHQLAHHLSAALGGREVTVERVRTNPFALSVAIRGLAVIDRDGDELLGWDELYANLRATSLFVRGFIAEEVRWVRPRLRLEIDSSGRLNVADLMPAPAAEEAGAASAGAPRGAETVPLRELLPPTTIDRFELREAEIVFADASRRAPFETRVGPMTFTLENFSTRHDDAAPYTFHGETEAGERFAWRGGVTLEPLGSVGRIAFERISAAKYAPYYADFVRFEIPTGWISIATDYAVTLGDAAQLRLSDGTIELDAFALRAPGAAEPVVVAPALRVEGLALDLAEQTLSLEAVRLTGGAVEFVRAADGRWELIDLLVPEVPSAPDEPAAVEPAPWTAKIGAVSLVDARVVWVDRTTNPTVRVELDEVRLRLTDLGTTPGVRSQLAAGLRWAGRGTLQVEGEVVLDPPAGELTVAAEGVELRPLAPYLAPWVDVAIADGAVGLRGAARFALPAGASPSVEWRGDFALERLAVLEGESAGAGAALVSLGALRLEGIAASTDPLAIEVAEIAIVDPVARLRIDEAGRVNALAVLRAHETGAPAVAPAEETTRHRPEAKIGRVTIRGGRFSVQDRSVSPAFAAELRDFGGTIAGLSSAQLARADVDLAGRLDGVSPLVVTGQINPLSEDVYTNLAVRFGGIDLTAFTPYTGRWLGYAVERGQLSLAVDYRVSSRDLVGENRLTFDRFYLGETVESPDALRLPIKLALALLRDRQGRIALDVPVRGNLDDPQFRYGRVVWQTVGNLMTRAATAPFALLGSMFGGRGEELGYQEFASGSAALAPEGIQKLETLARALTERPELNLEILARPEPALDRAGLRAARLEASLRALHAGELARASAETIDPAAVELDEETIARLIARAYAAVFPAGAGEEDGGGNAASLAVDDLAAVAAPPAASEMERREGFFLVRVARRLFRGGAGEASSEPEAADVVALAEGGERTDGPTVAEMRERLLARIEVGAEEYRELARQRANVLRDWLVNAGGIEPGRIDVRPTGELPPDTTTPRDRPRVEFALR